MKINKLSLIAALALASLALGGAVATAQDAKDSKEGKGGKRGFPTVEQRMERLTEELKLTEEQKPKVKAVLEEEGKKMREMRDLTPEQRREKGPALREEMSKKMKGILTDEQFQKWEKMPRGGRPG